MDGVDPVMDPVKPPENLRGGRLEREVRSGHHVLDDVAAVFETLANEEGDAQRRGGAEAGERQPAQFGRGGAQRDRHGQARGQEERGVDGAIHDLGVRAGDVESLAVEAAIDRVGTEQRSEEQHFARQE